VFVLAVLAFAALVAIARNLPDSRPEAPSRRAAGNVEELSIFSRWNGRWEGTLTAYRLDGTPISSVTVQRDHTSISPTEQSVLIRFEYDDGRRETTRAMNRVVDGRLESRVQRPDGSVLILSGKQADGALFWYWRDEAGGSEESRREAILELEDEDLFTVDGVRHRSTDADDLVLLEGRYRRIEQVAD
jgi:hypothetical protein